MMRKYGILEVYKRIEAHNNNTTEEVTSSKNKAIEVVKTSLNEKEMEEIILYEKFQSDSENEAIEIIKNALNEEEIKEMLTNKAFQIDIRAHLDDLNRIDFVSFKETIIPLINDFCTLYKDITFEDAFFSIDLEAFH